MNRYLLPLLPLLAFATGQIKMDHAVTKPLGKVVRTNAQITQLADQKQQIVSQIPGHIEAYYVEPGQEVREGDRVVLIESMAFSKMSADYIALTTQLEAARRQLASARKLYQKGLTSQNELNDRIIAVKELESKRNALASQLHSLGTDPSTLTKTTDKMVLYAHASGVVGKLLVPLHSNIDAQTPLLTIVDQNAYYAVAYLGVKDALKIDTSTKGWVKVANKEFSARFVQLMPTIDPETQRAKVLFEIDKSPKVLLLNAFVEMDIAIAPQQEQVMVKRSALTLFKGEWVVFVEKHHGPDTHEEEEHTPAKALDHEDHDTHEAHEEEGEHEAHEHEEHEEVPYEPRVVEIIAYAGEEVAVKGIEVGTEYVSDGVYFVKSMILKSSLGEHGH
jgi:RND family efflux transporter MFP subunit